MNMIALYSTCVWTQCICIWLGLDNFLCYYFLCVIHSFWHICRSRLLWWNWITPARLKGFGDILKVVSSHSKGESVCIFHSNILLSVFFFFPSFFKHQIQNADDVLITPLEKFRKEQIGAAKVRDHLRTQLATEQRRYSTRCDTLTSHLQGIRLPHSMEILIKKKKCDTAKRSVPIRLIGGINKDVNYTHHIKYIKKMIWFVFTLSSILNEAVIRLWQTVWQKLYFTSYTY